MDTSFNVVSYDKLLFYNEFSYKNHQFEKSETDNLKLEDKSLHLASRYDIIYKRDIFRTSKDSDSNKQDDNNIESISEQELAALKKTDLKLKLWGTATGGEDSENYAVIETDKDNRQELYKKGDKIEDAVIKKILRFSVILSRNGIDERLEITDESYSKKSRSFTTKSVNSASSAAPSSEENDKIEIPIKRSMIDESMKDINALMNQVRIRPHFTSGNADGILLYGIKQDSMFKEMGIQNGDIIMGVDGKEINSVDDAISLYDRLKNSSEMKMQIRRRGQIKEIKYNVE
ncbi:MAG: PDZ domain-containing protein [Desulfamplus sp.]|nr:PDZ domain-containing protein [Desulfamplus sp.]